MKTRRILLSVMIALLICGPFSQLMPDAAIANAYGQAPQNSAVDERIRHVESGLLPPVTVAGDPAMKWTIAERMKFYNVPGVSVAVINNGEIEWARGYGVVEAGGSTPVTPETRFQAASISKPVAAMGALKLVEDGKLSLDENVNDKLQSWKVPDNEFTKEQKVTLRRLLSHTAGLTVHGFRGYAAGEPMPTLTQVLNGEKPANSDPIRVDAVPGTLWRYSGGGYTVAQQLVIDTTHKSFGQYMQETVLSKLGMTDSAYQQGADIEPAGGYKADATNQHPLPEWRTMAATGHRPDGKPIKGTHHAYPELAAAGLWTTPSDLARFAIEMQKSYAGKSNRVLSQAMTRQMLTEQKNHYALGLGIDGSGRTSSFAHGGSNEGFRCFLTAFTETGQGAVVMTNSDNGSPLANEIVRAIAAEYNWPTFRTESRAAVKVDPKTYESYVGDYKVMGDTVHVTLEGGKLFILAGPLGDRKIELLPETDSRFFIREEMVKFAFVKNDKGQVNEMTILGGGDPIKATRVK